MDIKMADETKSGEASANPLGEAVAGLKTLLGGRTPMLLPQLVEAVAAQEWPETVFIHPSDFYVMTVPILPIVVPQVHKDNTGPYFYMSRTKVRPVAPPMGSIVDISSWESPTDRRIQLAKFER